MKAILESKVQIFTDYIENSIKKFDSRTTKMMNFQFKTNRKVTVPVKTFPRVQFNSKIL